MRTRQRGPVSPPSSSPPRPLRVQGTKRSSVPTPSTNDALETTDAEGTLAASKPKEDETIALTPRKAKKVRFSEPLPEADTPHVSAVADFSTGLTPSLRRTSLEPIPRTKRAGAGRRKTLPGRLVFSPPPATHTPDHESVQEMQFQPLRQVLSSRLRRRLRRSHLSEELNDIAAEHRETEKEKQELQQLRKKGHLNEARIQELMFELESQRQMAIQLNSEEEQNVREMEEELQRLRVELLEQKDKLREDGGLFNQARAALQGPGFGNEELATEVATDLLTDMDVDEDLLEGMAEHRGSSPIPGALSSSSPLRSGGFEASSPPTHVESPGTDHCVHINVPEVSSSPPGTPTKVHNGVQCSLRQEGVLLDAELQNKLKEAQRDAQLVHNTHQQLKDQLQELGFVPAPNMPLNGEHPVDPHVGAIRTAFRDARLALERLVPGETTTGINDPASILPECIQHIEKLVTLLHSTRKELRAGASSEAALRRNLNDTLEKETNAENRITVLMAQRSEALQEVENRDKFIRDLELAAQARIAVINERNDTIATLRHEVSKLKKLIHGKDEQISQLNQDKAESDIGLERAKSALEKYREEVKDLETVAETLQAEDEVKAARLRDLEGIVGELETRGAELEGQRDMAANALAEVKKAMRGNFSKTRKSLNMAVEQVEKGFENIQGVLEGSADDALRAE